MSDLIGMVLGSGLGSLMERVDVQRRVAFSEVGLPVSTVPGHEGEFVFGLLGGNQVIIMNGRVHLYEGHDAKTVTAGVRWMQEQGAAGVVLTNAAGSLNESAGPGTWMLIEDHLNLTTTSPLEGGQNFVDMSEVYDREWLGEIAQIGSQQGLVLSHGVYAGLRGPQYETPAEIRMLRTMGADAVGMSTVLEAIQAKALGMRVLGLSCLTNFAAGMPQATLDHGDVVATGKAAAEGMIGVLEEWLDQ